MAKQVFGKINLWMLLDIHISSLQTVFTQVHFWSKSCHIALSHKYNCLSHKNVLYQAAHIMFNWYLLGFIIVLIHDNIAKIVSTCYYVPIDKWKRKCRKTTEMVFPFFSKVEKVTYTIILLCWRHKRCINCTLRLYKWYTKIFKQCI